jgi:hypothetical protein
MKGIIIHLSFAIVAVICTGLFWYYDILGLNMYGACSFIITDYTIPILTGVSAFVFIVLGYFSLSYFNKHMP